MIDGKITVRNQKVLTCDEEKVRADNLKTAQAIWDRGAKTPLPEKQSPDQADQQARNTDR